MFPFARKQCYPYKVAKSGSLSFGLYPTSEWRMEKLVFAYSPATRVLMGGTGATSSSCGSKFLVPASCVVSRLLEKDERM